MAKDKMVESYEVWNSGGNIYVATGQLKSGEWFSTDIEYECVIFLYKTEKATWDDYGMDSEDFIRMIDPTTEESHAIFMEIFEEEKDKGTQFWREFIEECEADYIKNYVEQEGNDDE